MYYEATHNPAAWAPKKNSGVPTAVAVFQDGDVASRRYGEDWLKDIRTFLPNLKNSRLKK